MEATLQALSECKTGSKVFLDSLTGDPLFKRRLTELGFITGEGITIVHNTGHGSIIVVVKDTKLALGRGEAERIFTTEI